MFNPIDTFIVATPVNGFNVPVAAFVAVIWIVNTAPSSYSYTGGKNTFACGTVIAPADVTVPVIVVS
jgi:hypothetical protein